MPDEIGKELSIHMAQRIELWPIDRLKPYEKNARTHDKEQIAQIANSIVEFGFTNPILVDSGDGIIAGHGRLCAAQQLDLSTVPVVVLDHLSERQRRAYVLADNQLALNAGWDMELLRSEVKDLVVDDFDISLLGFSDEELSDSMPEELDPAYEGEAEEIPEPPEDPITKPGDLWILGEHRLLCGDSTNVQHVEKLMDGKKADMVFTDPPYGVDYEGINNDSRDGLTDLLQQAFSNVLIAAQQGAPVYVFHSDRCADIFHEVFRQHFHFSSMVIWVKPSLVLSQTDYQSRHEPCLYGWIPGAAHQWCSNRKQTSIWEFGKESVQGHSTPKPTELISYALGNSSKANQLVLDPFGGSGSTLIACERQHRHARLMELDPRYCDVIVKRWEEYTSKTAICKPSTETMEVIAA